MGQRHCAVEAFTGFLGEGVCHYDDSKTLSRWKITEMLTVADKATYTRLEQYKRATGTYPARLAELPDEIYPDFYTDPFTGQPLAYSPVNDSFQLYSLGPDVIDDRGASGSDGLVWGK